MYTSYLIYAMSFGKRQFNVRLSRKRCIGKARPGAGSGTVRFCCLLRSDVTVRSCCVGTAVRALPTLTGMQDIPRVQANQYGLQNQLGIIRDGEVGRRRRSTTCVCFMIVPAGLLHARAHPFVVRVQHTCYLCTMAITTVTVRASWTI